MMMKFLERLVASILLARKWTEAARDRLGRRSDGGEEEERRDQSRAKLRAMQMENAKHDPLECVRMVFEERWENLGYPGLLPEERDYLHISFLDFEVINGGFAQYLDNDAGDHASETLQALTRIGAMQTHAILSDVVTMLGSRYPAKRAERLKRIAMIEADSRISWRNRLRELSEAYWNCVEPVKEPAVRAMQAAYRLAGVSVPSASP